MNIVPRSNIMLYLFLNLGYENEMVMFNEIL